MKLILVRHAESVGNAKKTLAYPDTPLSELGEMQAKDCAERLKKYKVDKVYSSPYLRARQTCEYYTKDYKVEELIREQTTGYEGYTYEEYFNSQTYKNEFMKNPLEAKAPNGESLREVYERAIKIRDRFKNEGGNILCFSHACFLSMLISSVFNNPMTSLNLVVYNARIAVLGENEGEWYLEGLNG